MALSIGCRLACKLMVSTSEMEFIERSMAYYMRIFLVNSKVESSKGTLSLQEHGKCWQMAFVLLPGVKALQENC